MKQIFLAIIAISLLAAPVCATVIEVTYTADNILDIMYQNGSAPQAITSVGSNAGNWQQSDTISLTLLPEHDYQLVFKVRNVGGAGTNNPGAFLAQITGPATGDLLTSPSWKWAAYDPDNPTPSDFDDEDVFDWEPATAYANNGGGIWGDPRHLNDPVAGITSDAQWIWDDSNTEGAETLWLRAKIQVGVPSASAQTTPEPATFAIWFILGGLGLVLGRRR